MKRLILLVLATVLWSLCGIAPGLAAQSLTVFFTANTYGAFAPCPT